LQTNIQIAPVKYWDPYVIEGTNATYLTNLIRSQMNLEDPYDITAVSASYNSVAQYVLSYKIIVYTTETSEAFEKI
jgi:hypothetical protein